MAVRRIRAPESEGSRRGIYLALPLPTIEPQDVSSYRVARVTLSFDSATAFFASLANQ